MPETLVTIGKYLDDSEAHIAAGLLQSEGIPVHIINQVSANPFPGVGSGSVRLQVPASAEREARRLLANRGASDEELTSLATGVRSTHGDPKPDRAVFGISSISDRIKRKEFWIRFTLFDIVIIVLILLAIWAAL